MKNPEILLYGPLGSGGMSAEFAALLAPLGSGPVTVRVNCPGGDAFDGLAIYNLIKQHGNVTVIIDGLAASAASYAILGAKTVEMAKDALVMIHPPHVAVSGESDDLRETADLLDRTEKQVAAIYGRRTGKTPAQVNAWLSGETWFTAEEAKSAGLIDNISNEAVSPAEVKFEFAYTFQSAPPAIAARLQAIPSPVEVDPLKAELLALRKEKADAVRVAKVEALIGSREYSAETRAALVRSLARVEESDVAPLLALFGDARRELDEMRAHLEEARACDAAVRAGAAWGGPGPGSGLTVQNSSSGYTAYMQQLKKSRS